MTNKIKNSHHDKMLFNLPVFRIGLLHVGPAHNLQSLLALCFRSIEGLFVNDFEATVFPLHPQIAAIKKHLLDAGAFYASMSGSGSTVFGLFQNDAEGRSDADLRALKQQFATMILLDDTFGEWQA